MQHNLTLRQTALAPIFGVVQPITINLNEISPAFEMRAECIIIIPNPHSQSKNMRRCCALEYIECATLAHAVPTRSSIICLNQSITRGHNYAWPPNHTASKNISSKLHINTSSIQGGMYYLRSEYIAWATKTNWCVENALIGSWIHSRMRDDVGGSQRMTCSFIHYAVWCNPI